jgi:N-acetyl-1-D-myo-inositol-2-amino-2-deoxy-alpha-D-glucopyranoside deacetylase
MPLPSVLAVHAHPDDEALFCGGVLARHAAAGSRTTVVTATWAEGTHRAVELARALDALGAGAPRLLGYADARVPESAPGRPRFLDAPVDEAVEAVVGHIRAVRPQVVITTDAYGGMTGHPDHVHARAAPGRIAAPPPAVQREVLGTEWYIRQDLAPRGGSAAELSA